MPTATTTRELERYELLKSELQDQIAYSRALRQRIRQRRLAAEPPPQPKAPVPAARTSSLAGRHADTKYVAEVICLQAELTRKKARNALQAVRSRPPTVLVRVRNGHLQTQVLGRRH